MITRLEHWNGYKIRFVELNGEWWAVLKDVCKALDLKTFKVSQRLDPSMMTKVRLTSDIPSKDTTSRARKSQDMLLVNEIGIYETLFASRRPEARKFRIWTGTVLQKLRGYVGLHGYEALRLTEEEVQDEIDHILDCLYWDEDTGKLMMSVTVQGGDVDQVPFDEFVKEI